MRSMALLAALLVLLPPAARAADEKPLRIHVFARAQEKVPEADWKPREKEADSKRKAAEQAAKTVDKELQGRHGKNAKNWPEDAVRQSDEAWQKAVMADVTRASAKFDEDLGGIAMSLANWLRDDLKKEPRVAVSDSADQADLTVEVLARAARTSFPAAAWLLYLKITPVGPAAAGAAADGTFDPVQARKLGIGLMANETVRGAVAIAHPYSAAEPFWIVRVFQQGTGYHEVVGTASAALKGFAVNLAGGGEKP
jgi:hypothetical protein